MRPPAGMKISLDHVPRFPSAYREKNDRIYEGGKKGSEFRMQRTGSFTKLVREKSEAKSESKLESVLCARHDSETLHFSCPQSRARDGDSDTR